MEIPSWLKARMRFGLGGKIIFPVVILFMVFSGALSAWVSKTSRDTLLGQAEERIVSQHSIFSYILEEKWGNFARQVQSAEVNEHLMTYVERGMVEVLGESLFKLAPELGAHFVNAYQIDGSFLASSKDVTSLQQPAFLESLVKWTLSREDKTPFYALFPKEVLNFLNLNNIEPLDPLGQALVVVAPAIIKDDFQDPVGLLMAGRILNGDLGYIEEYADLCRGELTIFQGGLRIATTLKGADGENLTGTILAAEVADEVLTGSGEYSGESIIAGIPYVSKYSKIMDYNNQPVGIWAMTMPIQGFIQQALRIRNLILATSMGALIIFSALLVLIINRSLKSINVIREHMGAVAEGHLGKSINIATHDEIQNLADGINKTTTQLKGLIGKVENSFNVVGKVSSEMVELANSLDSGSKQEETVVLKLDQATSSLSNIVEKVGTGMTSMQDLARNNLSSLNELSISVREMANSSGDLSSSVENTTSSITQMAAATAQTADNVSDLNKILGETSTAMDEIEKATKQIEKITEDARKIAQDVSKEASEKGHSAMDNAKNGMGKIKDTVSILGETIKAMMKRSEEIGGIVDIISNVGEQTNLLALNASIIASQAGEKGRGFAVVAEEIRDLSDRTKTSLKEISGHITGIQRDAQKTSEEMSHGIEAVDSGIKEVDKVGEVLEAIMKGSESTRILTEQLASQTVAQSTASSRVASTLLDISSRSTELSAAAQQQGQTGQYMKKIAEDMGDKATQMKMTAAEQAKAVQLINQEVEKTTGISENLALGAVEAKEGVTAIAQSSTLIQTVLEENRQRVTSLKKAVDNLNKQADEVRSHISIFKLE